MIRFPLSLEHSGVQAALLLALALLLAVMLYYSTVEICSLRLMQREARTLHATKAIPMLFDSSSMTL